MPSKISAHESDIAMKKKGSKDRLMKGTLCNLFRFSFSLCISDSKSYCTHRSSNCIPKKNKNLLVVVLGDEVGGPGPGEQALS